MANQFPIIGVLAQDYYGNVTGGSSYIAASYVKYLEAAGARVVPVFINRTQEYYEKIVNYTNGLLIPGGNNYFNRSDSGFGLAGKVLYKLAIQANNGGDYYPVWGTCLGFQFLTYLSSGNQWWLSKCKAGDIPLPLEFLPGANSSRLLKRMPQDVKLYLQALPVTINYHKQCMTPENFHTSRLDQFYRIVSVNQDFNNVTFVSTMEALDYPIYGTQWHPEKNQFEFILKKGRKETPHTYEAIRVGQHFANFFVNEARLSNHRFPDTMSEQAALIYNYSTFYTSPSGSSFEQCYFFD